LMRKHAVRWVAVALGVGLLVGGISAAVADQDSSPATSSAAKESPDFGADGPGPSDTPDPALSDKPVPTLPPGDPGDDGADDDPDGPGHADDPEDAEDADAPDKGRLSTVPAAALLDAETVGAVAGGTWAASGADVATAAEACLTDTPAGAGAGRSSVLGADDASGRLVQQVATWRTVRAASTAVESVSATLAGCGFTATGDPRLGDASAQLERTMDGALERVVVIAAEGATVTLTGSGSAAAAGTWESLADLAMGGLCAAGVHGCH
jgi:hypothetical protein